MTPDDRKRELERVMAREGIDVVCVDRALYDRLIEQAKLDRNRAHANWAYQAAHRSTDTASVLKAEERFAVCEKLCRDLGLPDLPRQDRRMERGWDWPDPRFR